LIYSVTASTDIKDIFAATLPSEALDSYYVPEIVENFHLD